MRNEEQVLNMHLRGFNPLAFGNVSAPDGECSEKFEGDFWRLCYIISGRGEFERDGNAYPVEAGEIFSTPPHVASEFRSSGELPWEHIYICFTVDMELPLDFYEAVMRCSWAGKIFNEMLLNCKLYGAALGRSAFLSSKLWELLAAVTERGHLESDYIQLAMNFMNSEYMTGITVEKIARRLNINRSYFYVLFKNRYGVSPRKFLLDMRLRKAEELMRIYGESPSSAAAAVGYEDIYNFSNMFQKKYGSSPREYIKGLR